MSAAALIGFTTGLSLILAIGAQNAFVLRQGILKQHVFWLCLFCASSDAVLIAAGVLGFGALTSALPVLPTLMTLGGATFLTIYGASRFWAARKADHSMELTGAGQSLTRTIAIAAAFTWLNPHVYLDTLGLIGAISTDYPSWPLRIAFGAGAMLASFVFFFTLGFGARLIAPIMRSPRAWQVLDVLIGLTMWALAAKLLLPNHI
ncbi:MAG: LysE/ArgO family amino acid transporter [Maritimibacter sp.]